MVGTNMRSREEEHFERHAGYPPDNFSECWEDLKVELNLTDEDLDMASAVVSYTSNKDGGVDVTCTNVITGKLVTLNLPIDCTQIHEWLCDRRMLIQDAFPQLTAAQREFMMTGLSEEEWAALNTEE